MPADPFDPFNPKLFGEGVLIKLAIKSGSDDSKFANRARQPYAMAL